MTTIAKISVENAPAIPSEQSMEIGVVPSAGVQEAAVVPEVDEVDVNTMAEQLGDIAVTEGQPRQVVEHEADTEELELPLRRSRVLDNVRQELARRAPTSKEKRRSYRSSHRQRMA